MTFPAPDPADRRNSVHHLGLLDPTRKARQMIEVTVAMDVYAEDWDRIVFPGRSYQSGEGEWEVDEPVTVRDLLEHAIRFGLETELHGRHDALVSEVDFRPVGQPFQHPVYVEPF